MNRITLEPKYAAEINKYVFDFTSKLAVGETISTAVITAYVYSGTDALPSNIISGSASISGAKVTQTIIGGTAGVTYLLIMQITTSASQQLVLNGYLTILPYTA